MTEMTGKGPVIGKAVGAGGAPVVKTAAVPSQGEKTSPPDEYADINAGMSMSDVLVLDSKGKVLRFHPGKDFLTLDDETIRGLSRMNRLMYQQILQVQSDYSEEADKDLQSVVIGDNMGRATDKLEKLSLTDKGRHTRWARPDRVQKYLDMGYRITPASKATTFLGAKNGHHEIGRLGGTPELILMDCDQDIYLKRQVAKGRRNRDLVKDKMNAIDTVIEQVGGAPTKEA